MKKQFYLIALALSPLLGKAQNSNVEKNITGIQVGLFGVDLYNEIKIFDKTTLRAELSLFPAIWGGDLYAKTGFAFYPALTIEPKYYYNISKRSENGKNTKNNSANYFGLQVRYIPDWFVISNTKNLSLANQINFIPTYGFRRNFSNNFNYEFKAGIGYGATFGNYYNTSGAVLDLSFKIGYDF
ncbi:hypothetical protein [Elizabethkingia anophelis]|uniref:hypothetical protein n=1 Tax=Elizabethkingia anophelis TaxID=1117645 RepID=UPI0009770DB4|nr:hypothetical protein [Elizabethkingia anophelis]